MHDIVPLLHLLYSTKALINKVIININSGILHIYIHIQQYIKIIQCVVQIFILISADAGEYPIHSSFGANRLIPCHVESCFCATPKLKVLQTLEKMRIIYLFNIFSTYEINLPLTADFV